MARRERSDRRGAYEPPAMDPARIEEMQAYIATRREAIGSDEP